MFIDLGKGRYVLDTNKDPYAMIAMECYRDVCSAEKPWLASSLVQQLDNNIDLSLYMPTLYRLFQNGRRLAEQTPNFNADAWQQVATFLSSFDKQKIA
ncbi:hypothetical protein [Collimonas silvisoli]|uniref:hypothetical protein n=1 Tax=Collimonas silvisoli TaxID=2825884 RepID=UPI001B8D4C1D|nr:hypothetical protein [Collimonas silvisoli]